MARALVKINKKPTYTRYTSGSGTYIPPANVKMLKITMVGGGGGGGAFTNGVHTGNGGSGGGYLEAVIYEADIQPSYAYSVGTGGSGGPAGYASWKLVGAYYSNNLVSVSFGGFITIEGVPTGEYYFMNNAVGSSFLTATGTNPTYGTVATNILKGRRVGREFIWEWDYKQTGGGNAGSGQYLFNTPFAVDLTYHKANNSQLFVGHVGTMTVVEESGGQYSGVNNAYLPAGTTNQIGVRLGQVAPGNLTMAQDWNNSFSHFGVAIMEFGLRTRFAVTGWSNTPLKDL